MSLGLLEEVAGAAGAGNGRILLSALKASGDLRPPLGAETTQAMAIDVLWRTKWRVKRC
jgi:hypothetical protein